MNTGALITMVVTQLIVASLTIYFYRRVLRTPMKEEPDSYSDNDDQPRS
ncbi:MAG: hypothetical protein LPK46_01180 [Bacteroidota bacterium]|nr:hypothetical protein [Bacteroidota bacterium]MDX5504729.1 hypothetical protein [Bacteroidota bacterium]